MATIDRQILVNWLSSLRCKEIPENVVHVFYKQYGVDTDKDTDDIVIKENENDQK